MTDLLLALAFGVALLFGYWLMSRLDGYLDKLDVTIQSQVNSDLAGRCVSQKPSPGGEGGTAKP